MSIINDGNGHLTESTAGLAQSTEHCNHLYHYHSKTDPNILKCHQTTTSKLADLQALQEEVETAVCYLKGRKSPGADSTAAELHKEGREETVKVLTVFRRKIW